MHPFEDTVSSVFRDIGFFSEATTYSKDGGIDVILSDSKNRIIDIQVKDIKIKLRLKRFVLF
ncbi:hypothetical protein EHQ23_06760 [Leptospira bourretii]|uniref:Restriction endonuclease type IV Mrr domain-containing protein n=1 Tax=Leptospira bourretii TaxID=2484962 RepID=A0A4R9ILA0_9LEPT|nr:hypothetical protein EHQ23_06760 [Leptospira bourretii]TGK89238.1 hypothetical protein EHQ26_19285 [Leptospira bourretii]